VKLIFEELKISPLTYAKPRVYWIGTSLLSGAPFYAASDYSSIATRDACAIDLVILSYTLTLQALAYLRENELG